MKTILHYSDGTATVLELIGSIDDIESFYLGKVFGGKRVIRIQMGE